MTQPFIQHQGVLRLAVNTQCVGQADEASGELEAVGPNRTHPDLVLIATGPPCFPSEQMVRYVDLHVLTAIRRMKSPVKWLKSLWQNDTGWQAIGLQMMGTANSISWFVVPSLRPIPISPNCRRKPVPRCPQRS